MMPAVLARALGVPLLLALLFVTFAGTALATPANDNFSAALVGGGDQVSASGNTFGATKEGGEPDHDGNPGGASAWFAWTAPRSQSAFVQVCTGGWGALLGVYRGDSVADLRPVASTHTSAAASFCGELRFPAISSVIYRIAVDGSSAGGAPQEGNFDFTVSATPLELPANDAFATAVAVKPTTFEWISGSTNNATREPGEPGDGGDLAGASVWYRWTAPSNGAMRVFPCAAGFRPTVAVYTGSSLASLKPVGTPAALDPPLTSECQLGGLGGVGFDAIAGETYSIVVDGAEGGWGRFQLRLLPAWTPVVDVYPPGTYIYKLLRLRGRGVAIQFGDGGGSQGVTFLCKLDRAPFSPCRSPRKWRHLPPGTHRFAVVAIDTAGNRDATAAVRTFKIGAGVRR
jgi:hypothetical protein